MASARVYKKRIRSVKNTQQMTKAMKMVSAAKLRRSQEAIVSARPYALKLKEILSGIAVRADISDHFLLMRRPLRRVRVFVLTSDRGLCGSFNAGIIRQTMLFLKENESTFDQVELGFVGRRGYEFFKKRHWKIFSYYENILDQLSYDSASTITQDILENYKMAELDAVFFIYNEFKSAIAQKVVVEELLPISRKEIGEADAQMDYIYEPYKEGILEEILPKHMGVQVYRMLLETSASEHGARMSAMDSATRNAAEMISRLTLLANRLRQQAITTELVEIVSGAEALTGQ
ncbi:MAG: ATP synthase F1 subunit gamma [Deltaproteobacteria bacterium]|nr:ATP synthase F1 subunit gamma [Deltaproteobacteria bacterium]